jgi:outer membrane protein assembly factor BamB
MGLVGIPVVPLSAASPAPGSVATVEESRDATPAYRVDASLDSSVTGATAKPPYARLWARNFGTVAGSPLTVGDRVFAVVDAAGPQDPGPMMRLVGLDARTGKDLWPSRELTTMPRATATYGGGLIYTQTMDGVLTAWDPTRGTPVWRTQLDQNLTFNWAYPPTWYKGVLYTQGGSTSAASAVRASDGHVLWNTSLRDTGQTPVPVDARGVWVAHDDVTYQLLDPASGRELRHYTMPPYFDGGGNPPVLAHGALWLRGNYPVDPVDEVTAFNESTGAKIRSFPADATPAFDADHDYIVSKGVLKALDAKTYATKWTYSSPVHSASVRLVANGYVYVEDADGMLRVLSAATGHVIWSVRYAPGPDGGGTVPHELDLWGFTVPGIGTAHGRLIVPTGSSLICYGPPKAEGPRQAAEHAVAWHPTHL